MRKVLLALSAALVCGTAQAQVKDTSFRDADGHRVQQLELTMNATPAKVWDAFTTDKGFSSWAVPVAHITLGNDGMMESSYKLDGKIGDPDNVRHRIDVWMPDELLIFHNEFVPPERSVRCRRRSATVRTILTFEPTPAKARPKSPRPWSGSATAPSSTSSTRICATGMRNT